MRVKSGRVNHAWAWGPQDYRRRACHDLAAGRGAAGSPPSWPCLLGAWLQCFGCLRWQHLQRSKLVRMSQHTLHFLCLRGKTSGQRHGFLWSSLPFTSCNFDVGSALTRLVGFHPISGEMMRQSAAQDAVRLALSTLMFEDDLLVTSKSWRQAAVTWVTLLWQVWSQPTWWRLATGPTSLMPISRGA